MPEAEISLQSATCFRLDRYILRKKYQRGSLEYLASTTADKASFRSYTVGYSMG